MLCFGMVPEAHMEDAWKVVADWGIEQMGDYGAFWYQMALASGYYAPHDNTPDDGSAIYTALTKCDADSWCSELAQDNETMTRESWHAGTYSHEWGTSAIVGVVWGLMGVHQTSPGFRTFQARRPGARQDHAPDHSRLHQRHSTTPVFLNSFIYLCWVSVEVLTAFLVGMNGFSDCGFQSTSLPRHPLSRSASHATPRPHSVSLASRRRTARALFTVQMRAWARLPLTC